MSHLKHKPTPKGKQQNRTTPKTDLPVGLRSAELIRDGRKSAVIVPVVEKPWVRKLKVDAEIHMPISAKGAGYLKAKVARCCFHATLASIPACEHQHAPAQFDANAQWHDVLLKAAWGSNRPAPTQQMDERAREGWAVIDFKPTSFPQEWRAAVEKRRAAAAEGAGGRAGSAGHDR